MGRWGCPGGPGGSQQHPSLSCPGSGAAAEGRSCAPPPPRPQNAPVLTGVTSPGASRDRNPHDQTSAPVSRKVTDAWRANAHHAALILVLLGLMTKSFSIRLHNYFTGLLERGRLSWSGSWYIKTACQLGIKNGQVSSKRETLFLGKGCEEKEQGREEAETCEDEPKG